MALCESPYHNDFGSFAESTTPPFPNAYSISSTPLILPRDWSDNYCYPSTSDAHYDFQSNHLETPGLDSEIIPSLAGLGIKNVDLYKDLETNFFGLYGLDDLQHHQLQDRRPNQRTYRTDSIYDVHMEQKPGGSTDVHNHHSNSGSSLSSHWSFSSILKATEINASNAVCELESSLSSGHDLEISALTVHLSGTSEEDIARSFEKLSAATGLSVADFAAQISATAEATLKRMAEGDELAYPNFGLNNDNAELGRLGQPRPLDSEISSWSPIPTTTPDPALPLVDINMRSLDSSWGSNSMGVNPADILPVSPPPNDAVGFSLSFLENQQEELSDSPENMQHQSLDVPKFGFGLEQSSIYPDPLSPHQDTYTLPLLKSHSQDSRQASDDAPSAFQSPSSSEYSPSLQSLGMKRNQSSRISTRRMIRNRDPDTRSLENPNDIDQQNLPPINLGTPVFDAHRGIAMEELKGKAERYRLRNQGRDYDKRWLISFAGKLSDRGELVEEFRCYVAGCKQVNKRRDHILIHVGAHLDQRPFKCIHCASRFLRKNECKRHELSHTGVRPFSCHLCPTPATTFVRQDLLKRHMKRTHRLDFKIDKENEEPPRPKKRAKH